MADCAEPSSGYDKEHSKTVQLVSRGACGCVEGVPVLYPFVFR